MDNLDPYYVLNNVPKEIGHIDWPEGFLNKNLERSAKGLGKYQL